MTLEGVRVIVTGASSGLVDGGFVLGAAD